MRIYVWCSPYGEHWGVPVIFCVLVRVYECVCVCMCMCVCVCVYVYKNIYTYCLCEFIQIYVCRHSPLTHRHNEHTWASPLAHPSMRTLSAALHDDEPYICMSCIYVCMYACMYSCVYACVYVCMRILSAALEKETWNIRDFTHTYIHTHIYIHTHT